MCEPLGWSRPACPEAFPKHIPLRFHALIFSRVFVRNNSTGLWQVMESPNPTGSGPKHQHVPYIASVTRSVFPLLLFNPINGI